MSMTVATRGSRPFMTELRLACPKSIQSKASAAVSRWSATLALTLAAAIGPGLPAQAAGEGIFMAPHRAIYEMTLANSKGGSSVTQVSGRMVYELTGSVCEGYTQNMRFVTRMESQNGSSTLTDLRSSSWEEAKGQRFRFNSTQLRDEKATDVTAGDATRSAAADIKVELTKPGKRELSVPRGAYFPVQHSIALIEAAKAGRTNFRADLYDGSEKGEKVYDTVSAIGKPTRTQPVRKLAGKNVERMDNVAAWPVSIAYYETKSDQKDSLPVYELSFLFLENGVSRNLLIDYGDFAIQGDLKEIDFLEPSKCEKK
jgi:hypothetical protein